MSPGNQERIFKPDYALELMRIAKGDLLDARGLTEIKTIGRLENVFYLAEQAIEKSLKAVLCYSGRPIPLVHDLGILVAKLPPESNPEFGYELDELSQFASIRRYEEGRVILTKEEAIQVIAKAQSIVDWATKFIDS